jgi:hypothetical protein
MRSHRHSATVYSAPSDTAKCRRSTFECLPEADRGRAEEALGGVQEAEIGGLVAELYVGGWNRPNIGSRG